MEEETDPEGQKLLRQAGRLAAVGTEMGIALAIGVFGGRYVDQKLETEPVFFWVGFALGIGAAGKAIFDAAKIAKKNIDDE